MFKNKRIIAKLILLLLFCSNSNAQEISVYRDYSYTTEIVNNKKIYKLTDSDYSTFSKAELLIKINTIIFRKVTKIEDEKLEKLYIQADKNKDGYVGWSEIEAFQSMLFYKYKYFICDTIIRPDRFIKYGGGKCDDWALMTAGFLRFWSYEPLIARFGRTKVIGHALCLVYVKGKIPDGYMWYELEETDIHVAGNYVPIDYEKVGGLKAIDRRWKISHIYIPESLYDKLYTKSDNNDNE